MATPRSTLVDEAVTLWVLPQTQQDSQRSNT
jgi:hypothetical protein